MNSHTGLEARIHDYEQRLNAREEHPEHDPEVDVPQTRNETSAQTHDEVTGRVGEYACLSQVRDGQEKEGWQKEEVLRGRRKGWSEWSGEGDGVLWMGVMLSHTGSMRAAIISIL
jgi:hypothetical protein